MINLSRKLPLGLFGGRDFDKIVFSLPIPTYDQNSSDHAELVALATEAEVVSAAVTFDPRWKFQRMRKAVRAELARTGLTERIERAVGRVVPMLDV